MIDAEDSSDFILETLEYIPKNKKEITNLIHNRDKWFCNSFNAFTKVARKNRPFYKKNFYNQINQIIKIMIKLHNLFQDRYFNNNLKEYAMKPMNKASTYHKSIHNKANKLNNNVSNYINRLTKY